MTVDWAGLADTDAGFLAVVAHVFTGDSFSEQMECKLTCESKGTVFFDGDCSQ